MLSLDILALLFAELFENLFFFFWGGGGEGVRLRRKYSMPLNGGACILNYSRAVLTNCRMVFRPSFLQGATKKSKTKQNYAKILKDQ